METTKEMIFAQRLIKDSAKLSRMCDELTDNLHRAAESYSDFYGTQGQNKDILQEIRNRLTQRREDLMEIKNKLASLEDAFVEIDILAADLRFYSKH